MVISRRDNPGSSSSSDEDEAELAVWITAALAAGRSHLPATAAAGRRGGVPPSQSAQHAVTTTAIA